MVLGKLNLVSYWRRPAQRDIGPGPEDEIHNWSVGRISRTCVCDGLAFSLQIQIQDVSCKPTYTIIVRSRKPSPAT